MRAGVRSQLKMLGEFGLIRHLHERFGRVPPSVRRGIGDDAAVVRWSAGRDLVVTTDLLVEGVHFRPQTASWADIGYKAAVANLSDMAAMGAVPHYLLVSLAVSGTLALRDVRALYEGLMEVARAVGVSLIGGDTSAARTGVFLNIGLIGSVDPGRALLRRGARAGDLIYVSGTLGDSLAGLALLEDSTGGSRLPARLPPAARRFLIERHLRPTARLRLGQLLGATRLATAAMDISDGLGGDLRRLCEESRVGAEIDEDRLPCSAACRAFAHASQQPAARLALTGGEDYELLFTVRPTEVSRLARHLKAVGCPVSCIGRILPRRSGLRVRNGAGKSRRLAVESFEHFRIGGA